jgi:hypothetical protein
MALIPSPGRWGSPRLMIERAPRLEHPPLIASSPQRRHREMAVRPEWGRAPYVGARPGVGVDGGCRVSGSAERGDGGICVVVPRLPLRSPALRSAARARCGACVAPGASRRIGVLSRSRAQGGKPTNDGLRGFRRRRSDLNPRMRVLQDLTMAIRTVGRLLPDSV